MRERSELSRESKSGIKTETKIQKTQETQKSLRRSTKLVGAAATLSRVFCGWSEPLLVSAANWLIEHAGDAATIANDDPPDLFSGLDEHDDPCRLDGSTEIRWDLSGFDVVLPSSHAINRLREILIQRIGGDMADAYRSPRFYSVGRLPSLLYARPAEWATDFEQTLAWAKVLSQSDPDPLRTLVPTPPEADATSGWMELAGTVRRLLTSMAAENLTFQSILDRAESSADRQRWEFLVDAQQRYELVLESADRCDPNLSALRAITEQRCRGLRPILLVGTTDLNQIVKAMLSQIKQPVTSLVAAPDTMADRFDSFGSLRPSAWNDHELPIDDEQLIAADSIADQARAVAEALADERQTFSIGQITIGVTDESQVAPIENQCRLIGVPTYRHLGYVVSETSVGRWMDLVVTYQTRRTWRSLAALVRHADVHDMIDRHFAASEKRPSGVTNWMAKMDLLMSEAFPRTVDLPLPASRAETACVTAVLDCVESWLSPLKQKSQPIRDWSGVLIGLIETLYANRPSTSDSSSSVGSDRTSLAIQTTLACLQPFAVLNASLDTPVDAITAMEMLTGRVADSSLPGSPSADHIDILGWLDLALDDSPALVVCGLNHPFVPEASSGDPFLPATLRSSVNQTNNDRRYARDVHAMHQMLSTRSSVRFIVGKRGADESPTPPSRLLAAATAEDSARRVCRLLTEPRPVVSLKSDAFPTDPAEIERDYFRPPPPQPGRTISTLSVTAFSAYLDCPYRFYLRHVLRMRPLDDAAIELAANQFGDLVHGALEGFGESDAKDEPDPDKIAEALITQLHDYAKKNYGDNTQATVSIQVRQAEKRLRAVAVQQAQRIAEGWRIHAVEASVDEKDFDEITKQPKQPTGIWLDGEFTGLRGRFDRIDRHSETGQWAILDYKTHGHPPEKKHLKNATDGSAKWVDLQLPLYRRFIPDLNIPADPRDVQLGYFNVAEKDIDTKINLASFTDSQFAAADELIDWCVRQIRDCRFEPSPDGVQYDDYEMMFNQTDRGWTIATDDNDDDDEAQVAS